MKVLAVEDQPEILELLDALLAEVVDGIVAEVAGAA